MINENIKKSLDIFFLKVNQKYNIPIEQSLEIFEKIKVNDKEKIKNKGTGAGGKNTNVNGKKFENITNPEEFLISKGFCEKDNYIVNDKIIYTTQNTFRCYCKKYFDIKPNRIPDEAYIKKSDDDKITIKILEKKNQTCDGSVETKLWASPSLKREYQIYFGDKFNIEYALCVSDFLKQKFDSNHKKYKILKQILDENDIPVFFGNDKDYYDKLFEWINK